MFTLPLLVPPALLMTKSVTNPSDPLKNNVKDKRKYFAGITLIIIIIGLCNMFIIIFAATFGDDQSRLWMQCFLFSIGEDFILLQTVKCLTILCCTSKKAITCFLNCCFGNAG